MLLHGHGSLTSKLSPPFRVHYTQKLPFSPLLEKRVEKRTDHADAEHQEK